MKTGLRTTTALSVMLAVGVPFASAQPAPARPGTPEGPGFGATPVAPTSPEGVTAVPGLNTTGDQTLQQAPTPTSAPPRIGLFPEFGAQLLNAGVDFHGIAFDHFLSNPTAGTVPGQVNNLFVFRPAADFDLQKLVGIPGGNVHLGLSFFGLRADIPQIITQAGGVMTGFQTTPSTPNQPRLAPDVRATLPRWPAVDRRGADKRLQLLSAAELARSVHSFLQHVSGRWRLPLQSLSGMGWTGDLPPNPDLVRPGRRVRGQLPLRGQRGRPVRHQQIHRRADAGGVWLPERVHQRPLSGELRGRV